MSHKFLFISLTVLSLLLGGQLMAQMPRTFSYQGVLTGANGAPITGNHTVTINIYDNLTNSTPLYIETHAVTTTNGIFNIIIGSATPIPVSLLFDKTYYLGITVDGGVELSPRTVMTAVPYAIHAGTADQAASLASGAVTSINGQQGAITLEGGGGTTINRSGSTITISSSGGTGGSGIQGVQNVDGTISITKPNGPVATISLADNGVTTAKIADGAVTPAKINTANASVGNVLTFTTAGAQWQSPPAGTILSVNAGEGLTGGGSTGNITLAIASGGITTSMLADGSVTSAKIASGAVGSTQIASSAVTDAKVASGISYNKLSGAPTSLPPSGSAGGSLVGNYPNPTIAAGVVTSTELATNAVNTSNIANGAVTTAKLNTTGASTSGQALIYNGSGIAWGNPTANDLVLPYSGSISSASNAFSMANSGTGRAGYFQLTGSTNSANALEATTSGTGRAGNFSITNSGSSANALYVTTNGTGTGLRSVLGTGSGITLTTGPAAVWGDAPCNGLGIVGFSGSSSSCSNANMRPAIFGTTATLATMWNDVGVYGYSQAGFGVAGGAGNSAGIGVYGHTFPSTNGYQIPNSGVGGFSETGWGVSGTGGSGGTGIFGFNQTTSGRAGYFQINNTNNSSNALEATTNGTGRAINAIGNVNITGNLTVTGSISKGSGSFKIDHPLDPENKFLYHSFVESDEMKNVYDGIATLDANGVAVVELPAWFDAVNGNCRYQLTAIGAPAPGLYIAKKIEGNRFTIAGGVAGMEVSWQVTGVRHDAYARKYPMAVEQEKLPEERGRYLHPEAFDMPKDRAIDKPADMPAPVADHPASTVIISNGSAEVVSPK